MRCIPLLTAALLAGSLSLSVPARAQQKAATPDTAVARSLRNEQRDDPKFAPDRHQGDGPFPRLVIRGATLIDGTGGPPRGPVDIVIEKNRIVDIVSVGVPNVPIDTAKRPKGPAREVDATGMYVLPGLADLHVHQGTQEKAHES